MSIAATFGQFMALALKHPEGPEVARAFNRIFQFDLTDAEPFYMEVRDGAIRVQEGDSGLDWRYRDWERATCLHTSARVLQQIVAGEYLITEAYFDREFGFSARRRADRNTDGKAIMTWLSALIRLALEQGRSTGYAQLVKQLQEAP